MINSNRLVFDVSFIFDLENNITGISRVVLSFIKEIVENFTNIEIIGIDFNNSNNSYRLCSYNEIQEHSLGFLNEMSLDKQDYKIMDNDVILLLGEQWLYQNCITSLNKIKLENNIKIISMIYDLVPFFSPEFYNEEFAKNYIDFMSKLVSLSDHYICISESTKKDFIKYYKEISTSKISLIKLGNNLNISSENFSENSSENFILSVSTIQPRKNYTIMLYVWMRLIEEYGSEIIPNLKIVGKKGWKMDDFLYYIKTNPLLSSKIKIIESASEMELNKLYKQSLFTIYPSFYEGWGLPIAESLSYGKFCIASNTSSMPEVGGEFCEYFSPYNSGELYDLVQKYYFNKEELEKKEKFIKNNYTGTLWLESTKMFLEILYKVSNK